VLRSYYHFQQAVVWRNCSTADTIFFMVVINPLDSCHEHRYCSRGIRSARDYMLQIEDIRRSERNDVLPIPISPYAIVRNTAYLRFPPNGASVPNLSNVEKIPLVRRASEGCKETLRQAFRCFGPPDPLKSSVGTTPSGHIDIISQIPSHRYRLPRTRCHPSVPDR
jgi:hypothetical protein